MPHSGKGFAKVDGVQARDWPRGMRAATAADYVGVSVSTLRAIVRKGGLKPIRLTPGRIVYLREDLDSYLDRAAGRGPLSTGNEWLDAFGAPP